MLQIGVNKIKFDKKSNDIPGVMESYLQSLVKKADARLAPLHMITKA